MPKLYEYFGIIVLFYSNEHSPIHVHGKYQNTERKAELLIINGKISKIRYLSVKGKKKRPKDKLNAFRKLVNKY